MSNLEFCDEGSEIMSSVQSMGFLTAPGGTQEDYIESTLDVNAMNKVEIVHSGSTQPDTNYQKRKTNYEDKRQRQSSQAKNNNIGITQWFGDELKFNENWSSGEYNETFRVGSVNINGISKQLNWIEWEIIVQTMSTLQLDMLGLTEPNINFNNKRTLYHLKDLAKKTDKHLQISTSCSNQLNFTEKKMGGTMSILAGRWAGRKDSIGQDSKGRWSSITLTGKQNRNITLITAYHVCQQKGGEGGTVFHQQQLDFEEEGHRTVNLRKRFCLDMVSYVRDLHSKNNIVILMGDFNDDLNMPHCQINKMLRDCRLCNVMHCTQGDDFVLPATYHRGRKCLDMIAITKSPLIPKDCIVRAGFLPFYHHFCTDHRMVYCDIDTDALFGRFNPDLTRWSTRPFTTNNIKKSFQFKTQLRKLYKKANLFEKVKELHKRFKDATGEELKKLSKTA
jgi:exonuclease III